MIKYSVGILLHEGVELLDFAGPGEAFTSAADNGNNLFTLFTVAKDTTPLICQNFLTIIPKYSFKDVPDINILILPGGDTHIPLADKESISWIKEVSKPAQTVLSVCTGALLLAEAGLLDGLKATTHYKWIKHLREKYPRIEVLEGIRLIDNGKFITTEGISAGIDGSLYLIEKLFGHKVALDLARYMMYNWNSLML